MGCGAGFFTRWMRSAFTKRVTGVDFSSSMIALAKGYNIEGIEYIENDLSKADSCGSEEYDIAFSCYVLNHAPDRATMTAFINNAHQTLRNGGKFMGIMTYPYDDPTEFN